MRKSRAGKLESGLLRLQSAFGSCTCRVAASSFLGGGLVWVSLAERVTQPQMPSFGVLTHVLSPCSSAGGLGPPGQASQRLLATVCMEGPASEGVATHWH